MTLGEYFNELIITGNYTGEYEIFKTSELLNCNIIVYNNINYSLSSKNYNFVETNIYKGDHTINPFSPIILLGWVNNNYYVMLYPKNMNLFNPLNENNIKKK